MTAKQESTQYSARNTEPDRMKPEADFLGSEFLHIPISKIRASHLNPRKRFDADALTELANSIGTHGILEPIVVRRDPRSFPAGKNPHFTEFFIIIAGERRWRAAQQAGLDSVPCIVREVADDREHLELALIENLVRRDIDPIEEAEGYRALLDMGYKQTQVAEKVNRGQPAIANSLRLLKLPESVQEHIRSGKLSVAHGIAICAYAPDTDVQEAIADTCVSENIPSHSIEKFDHRISNALREKNLLVPISSWSDEDKQILAHLQEHHPRSLKKDPYGYHCCLNPKVYREAQQQVQETLRQALEQKRDEAGGNVVELSTLGGKYQRISDSHTPAGCTKECPCRCTGTHTSHRGDMTACEVCIDPARFEKLKADEKKANRAAVRETCDKKRGQARQKMSAYVSGSAQTLSSALHRALIPLLWDAIRDAGAKRYNAIREQLGLKDELSDLPSGYAAYSEEERWDELARLPLPTLIRLAAECTYLREAEQAAEWLSSPLGKCKSLDWFLGAKTEKQNDDEENSRIFGEGGNSCP